MSKLFDQAVFKRLVDDRYEHYYLNVVLTRDGWSVCWYPQWSGASKRNDAVAMRREFQEYLRGKDGCRSKIWPLNHFKTIRII